MLIVDRHLVLHDPRTFESEACPWLIRKTVRRTATALGHCAEYARAAPDVPTISSLRFCSSRIRSGQFAIRIDHTRHRPQPPTPDEFGIRPGRRFESPVRGRGAPWSDHDSKTVQQSISTPLTPNPQHQTTNPWSERRPGVFV